MKITSSIGEEAFENDQVWFWASHLSDKLIKGTIIDLFESENGVVLGKIRSNSDELVTELISFCVFGKDKSKLQTYFEGYVAGQSMFLHRRINRIKSRINAICIALASEQCKHLKDELSTLAKQLSAADSNIKYLETIK